MTQALVFPTISSAGTIDAYIQATRQFPLLSHEDEIRLATRFRDEDDPASQGASVRFKAASRELD